MSKVIILKGLPASGKSTWAREYMQIHPNTKRVNKDDLRAMLDDGKWDGKNEKFVLQVRDNIIAATLKSGNDIIVDDTNLSPKHFARISSIVPKGTEIVINDSFLDVSLAQCIIRDNSRDNPVGSKVIERMYSQFLSKTPMTRQEKSEIWFKTNEERIPEYVEYDPDLDDILIVDIDGTLALKCDRSPFDGTRVSEDTPHIPVIELVCNYQYTELVDAVILVSGREDTDQIRNDTEEWMKYHNIPYLSLFMRPEGDYRKDVLIKQEIYHKYIEGKYNVIFVLDDRDQTVAGWRELGLPTFQVAEGNF